MHYFPSESQNPKKGGYASVYFYRAKQQNGKFAEIALKYLPLTEFTTSDREKAAMEIIVYETIKKSFRRIFSPINNSNTPKKTVHTKSKESRKRKYCQHTTPYLGYLQGNSPNIDARKLKNAVVSDVTNWL